MTDFYTPTGVPAARSGPSGTSAAMRAEFVAIQDAMAKLASYTGNGGKTVKINAAGTSYDVSKVVITEPATSATLTIPDGVTFTGPPASGTAATLAGAETLTNKTLVAPALGTPASGVLTNCTGTAAGLTSGNVTTNANLTGHITSVGNAAVLGSFTSAQLATALTDETGSGAAVFATSPTLVTPILGTPTSGNLANCTFPTLNQNTTGSAGSLINGGALNTPASGNLANCTFPTLNQNTTGSAATLSATLSLALGGTGQTSAAAAFLALAGAQSAAASGYIRLGGLLIQWGTATSSGTAVGNTSITFPLTFTTLYTFHSMRYQAAYGGLTVAVSSSVSGASVTASTSSSGESGIPVYWLAIGN